MPRQRLSLRLGQLPHDVLADLAAQLCSESPALQAAAEECMAAHNLLPHETVERVLLSPDLVPLVLGPLKAEDGAAAAVCSQWLAGWKATNEPRRRLKQVPLDFPEELTAHKYVQMVVTPDGRLVVCTGSKMHTLDRSMHVLQTVAGDHNGVIAASDDSVFYACHYTQALYRTSHDGTVDAEYRLEGHCFHCPVLAPGGLLFCVMSVFENGDDLGQDEIIALDAQTLQLRHRFGLELIDEAWQLTVNGDELYVSDVYNHRLQVFSLSGEHRRSIMGEWKSPLALCCVKDRIYLVEQDEGTSPSRGGRRLLVLSLQGDILQVVTHPTDPTAAFHSICCYDDKLLAFYSYSTERVGFLHWEAPLREAYGMLALQGP